MCIVLTSLFFFFYNFFSVFPLSSLVTSLTRAKTFTLYITLVILSSLCSIISYLCGKSLLWFWQLEPHSMYKLFIFYWENVKCPNLLLSYIHVYVHNHLFLSQKIWHKVQRMFIILQAIKSYVIVSTWRIILFDAYIQGREYQSLNCVRIVSMRLKIPWKTIVEERYVIGS